MQKELVFNPELGSRCVYRAKVYPGDVSHTIYLTFLYDDVHEGAWSEDC